MTAQVECWASQGSKPVSFLLHPENDQGPFPEQNGVQLKSIALHLLGCWQVPQPNFLSDPENDPENFPEQKRMQWKSVSLHFQGVGRGQTQRFEKNVPGHCLGARNAMVGLLPCECNTIVCVDVRVDLDTRVHAKSTSCTKSAAHRPSRRRTQIQAPGPRSDLNRCNCSFWLLFSHKKPKKWTSDWSAPCEHPNAQNPVCAGLTCLCTDETKRSRNPNLHPPTSVTISIIVEKCSKQTLRVHCALGTTFLSNTPRFPQISTHYG